VGNVADDVTSNDLRLCFEEYGEVLDAIVMKGKNDGRHRGFGFVTMADPLVSQDLITRTITLAGKKVWMQLAEGNAIRSDKREENERKRSRSASPDDEASRWPEGYDTADRSRLVLLRKLPKTVNKERLALLCSRFGEVETANTNAWSLTGYVVFQLAESSADALAAGILEVDNKEAEFHSFDNRPELGRTSKKLQRLGSIETPEERSQRLDRERLTKVFIGNLPMNYSTAELRSYWEDRETGIEDVKYMNGRGFGYVTFTEEQIAARVITEAHVIEGKLLNVTYTWDGNAKPEQVMMPRYTDTAKLFIGNLDTDLAPEEFEQEFRRHGKVIDYVFFPDRNFGYVKYAHKEDAQALLTQEIRFGDRACSIKWAKQDPKTEEIETKLFVGQLPYGLCEADFVEAFNKYGTLIDHVLFADRGFGYVRYARKSEAELAVTQEVSFGKRQARVTWATNKGPRHDRDREEP